MMSTVGTATIWFFESKLFLSSFVIEWANRCISIRPIEYHASNDFDAGTERDRIS